MNVTENAKSTAFPKTTITEQDTVESYGLTKLEYFAAKAMQGLLSNPEYMKEYKGEKYIMQSDIIANVSIRIANTVLTELEK